MILSNRDKNTSKILKVKDKVEVENQDSKEKKGG